MACRLVGAKPVSESMLQYHWLDLRNKLQWNFNRNLYIFIQENAYENVGKKLAILTRPQFVNPLFGRPGNLSLQFQ